MSGEDIPYQLRPNKFIDRQIFIDLLCRLVPAMGSNRYVYISMGGKHLVDHTAVYRHVGITKLFSFDLNGATVARQSVNKPIDSAVCQELSSGNLASAMDGILAGFEGATNVVVWLDYTNPHDRLTQLQELIEIAKRLQVGDIVRVTLNANLGSLDGPKGSGSWKSDGFGTPQEYRSARLKDQLGELVPVDVVSVGDDDFPSVLSRCIGMAFSQVESERSDVSFMPVLNTTYRDGQRMVTVTCIVRPRKNSDGGLPNLNSWNLIPGDWGQVTAIAAPDLSIREKLRIDEHLSLDVGVIAGKLGFDLGSSPERSLEVITSYKQLHRYYPSFHHVDT